MLSVIVYLSVCLTPKLNKSSYFRVKLKRIKFWL